MTYLTCRCPSVLAIIFSLTIPFQSVSHAEIQMLDRIIAIVDNTTVTQSELDSRIDEVLSRVRAAGAQMPPMSVIREQVLDQLVSETLQLNMADRYGVAATDEEVLDAIKDLQDNRGLNEAQMIQGLAAEGLSLNEFKENLRRQLTLQTITRGAVGSRIRISDQDIDNFLQSADAKFWISPEYHLQHILIPVAGSSTSDIEAAQAKSGAIYQQLVDGGNFTSLAIAESKGPAALNGGDLGARKSSELPTLFAEKVPELEIGEVSEPFRSRAGFHILKLIDKKGDTKQVITQSKVRHILIEPNEILSEEQARARVETIRQRIQDGEDFGEVAKLNTDDIGSKMTGGDLGWSKPGLFVPEFEQTMENLEIGAISEPIKTQFGWHIIQVTDRRDEDFSEDVIRQRAEQLLIGRRFEDEVQLWLQELRDQAYVEVKI